MQYIYVYTILIYLCAFKHCTVKDTQNKSYNKVVKYKKDLYSDPGFVILGLCDLR